MKAHGKYKFIPSEGNYAPISAITSKIIKRNILLEVPPDMCHI